MGLVNRFKDAYQQVFVNISDAVEGGKYSRISGSNWYVNGNIVYRMVGRNKNIPYGLFLSGKPEKKGDLAKDEYSVFEELVEGEFVSSGKLSGRIFFGSNAEFVVRDGISYIKSPEKVFILSNSNYGFYEFGGKDILCRLCGDGIAEYRGSREDYVDSCESENTKQLNILLEERAKIASNNSPLTAFFKLFFMSEVKREMPPIGYCI